MTKRNIMLLFKCLECAARNRIFLYEDHQTQEDILCSHAFSENQLISGQLKRIVANHNAHPGHRLEIVGRGRWSEVNIRSDNNG